VLPARRRGYAGRGGLEDRDRLAHLPRRRLRCLRVSSATPCKRYRPGNALGPCARRRARFPREGGRNAGAFRVTPDLLHLNTEFVRLVAEHWPRLSAFSEISFARACR